MKPKIVITGMGAITPIGLGVREFWQNLVAGRCGIGQISRFDAGKLPVQIAAEVEGSSFLESLPRHLANGTSRFMQFAYIAGKEALEHAGLENCPDRHTFGICMGTAMAGVDALAQGAADYCHSSRGKISPHLVPRVIGNMAAANLAINYGFHGPGFTLNTACSAGCDAAMIAAMLLLSGQTETMLVVGGESILTPCVVSSLAQARALSRRNDSPQTASRPFDALRDGFVVGEGGGAIVLETEDHARKRGAKIFATLSGWGNSQDGYHITAPDPEGAGAAICMKKALDCAGMSTADIGYINAHGTSTQLGDKAETLALKKVFGGRRNVPPVSSTKGATGHLMGAGGLTELIVCIKAMEEYILPPTLNLENPDPECDLDYVPNVARECEVKAAMSNSMGFGGQNSSLIVGRYMTGEK